MLTNKQVTMFETVARNHPQLRAWLSAELDKQHEILVKSLDSELMRRAQGHAQCLSGLIRHLDEAVSSPRHTAGSST